MSLSGKDLAEGSSSPIDYNQQQQQSPTGTLSRYESQKKGLEHFWAILEEPETPSSTFSVQLQSCVGLPSVFGSIWEDQRRLRAAYEENGGSPETNPFASGSIRVYLREVRECQAKARGIPYKKKKKITKPNDESTSIMHFS
ncbi:ALOG domain [Sesbania bispinosa]|nr:ALOG domain [Sesbania bispinosa]